MDHRAKLIAALLGIAGMHITANAGYALLAPPPGWNGGNGLGAAYQAAANESWVQSTVRTNASLNVGGRGVVVPASMRLSANAPRFAARALFGNPLIALGSIAIMAWVQSGGFKWDETVKKWVRPDGTQTPSDGYEYRYSEGDLATPWSKSVGTACQQFAGVMSVGGWTYSAQATPGGGCRLTVTDGPYNIGQRRDFGPDRRPGSCPAGWYFTSAGCVQTPPPIEVTPKEFEDGLAPVPVPDAVPNTIPMPWPVEVPIINPDPGPDPWQRPLVIPTGDPVKVPNSNPERWVQPGTRINPANDPNAPWRVDIQPVEVPRPAPSPNPNPSPSPDPRTPYTPPTPDPRIPVDPNAPPVPVDPNKPDTKPSEKAPGLCDEYPDIVACQNLGNLTSQPLQTKNVPMEMKKEQGFGPPNGTCPAPKTFMVLGKQMAFRWDLLCDFANAIRPLLIGFAYLSAALAFMGLSRKDS